MTTDKETEAIAIVHWPGKDTLACDAHLHKLVGLGAVLGIRVSWTPLSNDMQHQCANCLSEKKHD